MLDLIPKDRTDESLRVADQMHLVAQPSTQFALLTSSKVSRMHPAFLTAVHLHVRVQFNAGATQNLEEKACLALHRLICPQCQIAD